VEIKQQIERRKRILIQAGALVMAALLLMAGTIRLLNQGYRPVMFPVILGSLLVFGWCAYAARHRKSTVLPASVLLSMWTIVLLGASAVNGGFLAPLIMLLPLIPLLGTMMIGPRAGLITLAGLGFILMGMMMLQATGFAFPLGPLEAADRDLLRGFNLFIVVVLVGLSAGYYASQTESMAATIYQQATHDYLTGLLNRRALDTSLRSEIDRASRSGEWLSLILADVDNFKDFNDIHGHTAGDRCLQAVAEKLRLQFQRSTDVVGRWGGEEFAILLPATDHITAEHLANQVREDIAAQGILLGDGSEQAVTITLGVGSIRGKRRLEISELVDLADQALYRGKEEGRNRVNVSIMRGQQFQLHALESRSGNDTPSSARPAS
jgi:diguanylate cyclase (GGDEF)-like protein